MHVNLRGSISQDCCHLGSLVESIHLPWSFGIHIQFLDDVNLGRNSASAHPSGPAMG
jgi:hypothetical protein